MILRFKQISLGLRIKPNEWEDSERQIQHLPEETVANSSLTSARPRMAIFGLAHSAIIAQRSVKHIDKERLG